MHHETPRAVKPNTPWPFYCTHAKIGPGGSLFAAKSSPGKDQFWQRNVVRVAISGPGVEQIIALCIVWK